MVIWEYKIEKVKLSYKSVGKVFSTELDLSPALELLTEAGQRGWELVGSWQVNPHPSTSSPEVVYTFKRLKQETSQYDPLWK